jgi:hypothetical protein
MYWYINSVTDVRTWASNVWGGHQGLSDLALDRIARHAAWNSPLRYGQDWTEWLGSLGTETITEWSEDSSRDHLIGEDGDA